MKNKSLNILGLFFPRENYFFERIDRPAAVSSRGLDEHSSEAVPF